MEQVLLHNRDGGYQHRLRDLTVTIEDDQGVAVYVSELLNPENVLSGPDFLTVDLPPLTAGSRLKVTRLDDTDLSGGTTYNDALDGYILSLGEVEILGCDAPQGGQ